ncbi:MAG: putative sulfate/molybdate transporter [bacterium]
MPICHGSGGLTAHYSFGARTGIACIIIGSIYIGLAFFFGKGMGEIFKLISPAILGIMVMYVGLKHCLLISDLIGEKGFLLACLIGIIAVFTNNLAIACGFGMILEWIRRYSQLVIGRS